MGELYHDVDIVERTEITPEGRVEKVYRVSAWTKSNVRFTLDVPEKDFSKAGVDKLLTARSAQLEDIKSL